MNLDNIAALLSVVKTKHKIDQKREWSAGSSTYFDELKKEIEEVGEELNADRQCYLEDELGDVFWDYLNLLYNLEVEGKISLPKVFERALGKYEERIDTISNGGTWSSVKEKQKLKLADELKKSS
jgi:NTP pyrophosphatase (non-canonical NTP hydrolase)